MDLTEADAEAAQGRMAASREAGHAVAVRYDRRRRHLVLSLHTGVRVTVPVWLVEGLSDAAPRSLSEIEISPSGLGLHWPRLDADVFLPALLAGVFGSAEWMASLGEDIARVAAHDGVPRRAHP